MMHFNWDDALDQIFGLHLVCPRCREDQDALVVGYARKASLALYAPRHTNCADGSACAALKLLILCERCAGLEHFRGELEDGRPVFVSYMFDCRRELDAALDYLADGWRDEEDLARKIT